MGQLFELKNSIQNQFDKKNIDSSDLDWILVKVLGVNRSQLIIDRSLKNKELRQIQKLAKKRLAGLPLSQVLGEVEFYGFDFGVNAYVLSPRPETELLVEIVKNEEAGKSGLDIGTGSGAIAITLEKLGGCKMTAIDISSRALRVAKKNSLIHKTKVKFIKSNLFSKIEGKFDFIVSNPPYIKREDIYKLDSEVKDHEPWLALDGGVSGYDFYEKIIHEAPKYLANNGKIYFEIGVGQSEKIAELLKTDFEDIIIKKDYNNIDRIVIATKKS